MKVSPMVTMKSSSPWSRQQLKDQQEVTNIVQEVQEREKGLGMPIENHVSKINSPKYYNSNWMMSLHYT